MQEKEDNTGHLLGRHSPGVHLISSTLALFTDMQRQSVILTVSVIYMNPGCGCRVSGLLREYGGNVNTSGDAMIRKETDGRKQESERGGVGSRWD